MISEYFLGGGADSAGMNVDHRGMFFVVGPLRTGTSLLSRCLDDHPGCICLCESEINRALFRDYIVAHHCQRMIAHGLSIDEAIVYLDRRKQDDFPSLEGWYRDIKPRLAALYEKPESALLGDKSPDFYRSPGLVRYLAGNHRLIYTVRNPRAICSSILAQDDSSPEEKAERWESLIENYQAWKPYLNAPNVLVIRYEDLVRTPQMTMSRVYAHLGLPDSSRFQSPFSRLFPSRFLWTTAVDLETGIHKEFDPARIASWTTMLPEKIIQTIESDRNVAEFMERFGYGK